MSVKANGRYMTWWNAKRINSRLKYTELAELLGLKQSQMGQLSQYFIGKTMPGEDMIRRIADIFGVPYDEAYSHFFNDWGGNKSKHPVKTFTSTDDILENPDKDPEIKFDIFVGNTPTEESEKEVDEAMDDYKTGMLDRESILKKVYGIVDFDTYLIIDEALLVGSSNDILKNIYGKIPFDAYQEVLKCL